jgi:hypothetical protein
MFKMKNNNTTGDYIVCYVYMMHCKLARQWIILPS